jgi:hypothetical protein
MCSEYLYSIHVHRVLSAYMLLENVVYSLLVVAGLQSVQEEGPNL